MRLRTALPALALFAALAGCGPATDTRWVGAPAASAVPNAAPTRAPEPLPTRPAPAKALAVGVRQLSLSRAADRPLPTTLWYPASGVAGGGARSGATPAAGRFPVVILSHGLGGLPQHLAPVATRWAAAGFVVAAPAYPHTRQGAATFEIADLLNQPADASYVLTQVLALDTAGGDPLAEHLDTAAVAAAGHSAGGYTTTGMLAGQRDHRVRAAIVVAGGSLSGQYAGAPTPLLFIHGDADDTVPYKDGRAAYDAAQSWPRAFLTLLGRDHISYLAPGGAGFDKVVATTTDFLRWTLYRDAAAKGRLASDGTSAGSSRWESTL